LREQDIQPVHEEEETVDQIVERIERHVEQEVQANKRRREREEDISRKRRRQKNLLEGALPISDEDEEEIRGAGARIFIVVRGRADFVIRGERARAWRRRAKLC
jgi:hypothetical protein